MGNGFFGLVILVTDSEVATSVTSLANKKKPFVH